MFPSSLQVAEQLTPGSEHATELIELPLVTFVVAFIDRLFAEKTVTSLTEKGKTLTVAKVETGHETPSSSMMPRIKVIFPGGKDIENVFWELKCTSCCSHRASMQEGSLYENEYRSTERGFSGSNQPLAVSSNDVTREYPSAGVTTRVPPVGGWLN